MNNSTISALVSMSAMQQRLDLIADNIANLNTAGYKTKESSFEDTLTRVQQQSKDYQMDGRATPLGFNLGFGSQLSLRGANWEQGAMQETGNPTDLALQGNGLFAVSVGGTTTYTRQGDFHFEPDSANAGRMRLVDNSGNAVLNTAGAPVTVPVGVDAAINEKGQVLTKRGENEPAVVASTLKIVAPRTENVLQAVDGSRFVLAAGLTETQAFSAAGNAAVDDPASGVGVRSGYLEQSNVDLGKQMSELMMVQRNYQLAARALSSGDQMLGLANTMRG
ncbi:flagellar hook-basal body protein [Paenibacillus spiritus]|uniref:Flagellar hook-basal body protein n=1 Tax=Paenibacillus spiritus TaxID=2496557 RepID=A0A5J5FVY2_9BACL|nr:flagellar hook-basal body protein [Paenibacillus spiritus]KAA8998009.1 flagellar hook-basal body protein [Paenibacillus spiritus]